MIGVRRHNSKKAQASKIPVLQKKSVLEDMSLVYDVFVISILRADRFM
jgi:hypothetical protein